MHDKPNAGLVSRSWGLCQIAKSFFMAVRSGDIL